MFSDGYAIQVHGLAKRFEVYDRPVDQLKQFLLPPLQKMLGLRQRQYFKEFWALKDISLKIAKGESWGIVGLNGSGKSTLLQIITGTLAPTSGTVTTRGRVAALLELGSGFNPEFTGRENVFMSGALFGISRHRVDEEMANIQAFADIGDYFDQPLGTYSSGMQMRIAFAVATSFNPEILIIDEALAVGDAYFQQKCFHRLEKFRESGGTMLFVSHDANTVKQLCDKVVLISHGHMIGHGEPRKIIDLYQGLIAQRTDMGDRAVVVTQEHDQETVTWKKATTITTNNDAELVDFKLLGDGLQPITWLESEKSLTVQYIVRTKKHFDRPAFGIIVRDKLGRSIFETSTYAMGMPDSPVPADVSVAVRFVFMFNLRAGEYSFSVGLANRGFGRSEFEEYSLLMHDVEQLKVVESTEAIAYGGIFNMKPDVTVELVGEDRV